MQDCHRCVLPEDDWRFVDPAGVSYGEGRRRYHLAVTVLFRAKRVCSRPERLQRVVVLHTWFITDGREERLVPACVVDAARIPDFPNLIISEKVGQELEVILMGM